MNHWRKNFSIGGRIAAEFVGHEAAGNPALTFQQLAEEASSSTPVSTALDQDVDRVAVLINRSPQFGIYIPDSQGYNFSK